MGNRFLKWVSALSAVALVSGVLALSASAHIGVSHSPLATDAPDLESATIEGDDVLFCYDDEIDEDELGDGSDFFVAGYNSAITEDGDDVEEDEDNGQCARVTFDDQDRALEEFTVAHSPEGAVESEGGEGSVEAAAELEGSTADADEGGTTAPNLVGVDEDSAENTLTYEFDQDVDCDIITNATDASNFGFHDADGDTEYGDAITDCDGNEVEVDFTSGEDVDDARRVFIENTAVDDDSEGAGANGGGGDICGEENEAGDQDCSNIEHLEDATSDPDLEDAERVSDDEVDFMMDEELEEDNVDEADVFVVEEDGTTYDADAGSCTTRDGNETIRCSFSDIEDAQDFEIVQAGILTCATAADDDGDCNTNGSAPIGSSAVAPGFTDAPDLETFFIEDEDSGVFQFDENFDDTTLDEGDFSTVDQDGDLGAAEDIEDNDDQTVTAQFDESDINNAVGGHVGHGDVADNLGNTNIGTAVGSDADESPTTGTATTTATDTTTVTTGTEPEPQRRRVATTLTIRYDRNDRAFKGAVGSSRKRCQTGRLVQLHRRGRGVQGSDTSNRRGNWKINKRARRGRGFADVARKVYTARNGDTIVCRPDESVTLRVGRRRG